MKRPPHKGTSVYPFGALVGIGNRAIIYNGRSGETTVSCKAKTQSVFIVKEHQKSCSAMQKNNHPVEQP